MPHPDISAQPPVRARRRRWPYWVALALAILAFALFIAEDQEVLHVESPIAAADPRFPEYVATLVGADIEWGDAYKVLRNGDQVFPAMLAAIDSATRSVSFESFIFDDGEVSKRFVAALAGAARRGVDVRIVLDAYGAADLPGDSRRALDEAGAKVVWFNPLTHWGLEETNYRTHRKILVVDGRVAFTGGIGVADHWRGNARSEEEWRDTQFEVTGPAVRALEAAFYENWIESGGRSAPVLMREPGAQGTGARSVVIWSNPTGGASNVKLLYLLSIAAARETVDIVSPYIVLDDSTRSALDAARQRGVRIRLLTDGEVTDAPPVKYASRHAYQGLLDAGYEIYEYVPTMMHVKAMVVDGVWNVIGSANFDNRSLELNDEVVIGVADGSLAAALQRDFEADKARATKLEPAAWRERAWLEKAREWLWSLFGELF